MCTLVKCDVKSAFRLLPIHQQDFESVGFTFEGQYYLDKAMPMGCIVSCSTCVQFSTFLEWMVKKEANCGASMHYLGEFLFVGKQGGQECSKLLKAFHKVCEVIGITIEHEKQRAQ